MFLYDTLTMPCVAPRAARQTAQPGKAQTSDGSSPLRSSQSMGSDDHSDAHSADTSGSVWISWVAVREECEPCSLTCYCTKECNGLHFNYTPVRGNDHSGAGGMVSFEESCPVAPQ